jgi:hypothetical protein
MKNAFTVFFVFLSLVALSQKPVPDLITDRPDQTESSSLVPLHAFQIETGFVMENKYIGNYTHKYFAYNTTLLRYGISNNLELRLGFEFLGEDFDILYENSNKVSGFGPLYTGFKIKILEEQAVGPEIAFLGSLTLPTIADPVFKPDYIAAGMRVAVAHNLSERCSFGYNLGLEWDGNSAAPATFYSAAFGFVIAEKLAMFAESYGLIYQFDEAEHLLDTGFTYLISPNFQLDVSAGMGINDLAIDNFISFGFTYRFLN